MSCIEFVVWFSSGVFLVPLLVILKQLPKIGEYVKQWAWLIAPLLAALLPQIGDALLPHCAKIDAPMWALIYMSLTYLTSQLLYWLVKKFGIKV
jgi:hypothetical protein